MGPAPSLEPPQTPRHFIIIGRDRSRFLRHAREESASFTRLLLPTQRGEAALDVPPMDAAALDLAAAAEGLLGRDHDRRRQHARALGEVYERRALSLAAKEWDMYSGHLHKEVARLLDGTGFEPLGGLELILEFTNRGSADEDKVTEFSNLLLQPIKSSDVAVVALAARCLGQLARAEGGHKKVKPHLENALDRLENGNRLEAAVLVLCELAEHAPTLTYGHLDQIFEHLWTAMRDAKAPTRYGAQRVLRACLALVASRPGQLRDKWYSRVYDEAQKMLTERPGAFGADGRTTEHVHGALLTIAELLDARGAALGEAQLDALMSASWAFKDHRERLVRQAVSTARRPPPRQPAPPRQPSPATARHLPFAHASTHTRTAPVRPCRHGPRSVAPSPIPPSPPSSPRR